MKRGHFGIGIEHGKTPANLGTLWRSAQLFGADYIFTVGRRYKRQPSDTMKTWRHIPLFEFETLEQLIAAHPRESLIVGVELEPTALELYHYRHPERAVYLLGAEDHGLTNAARAACHHMVVLPGEHSMNVACAGTVVMYDRCAKARL